MVETKHEEKRLMITAPLKPTEKKSNEKTIKIEFTGKPAIRTTTEKTEESREETTENPIQETPEK